MSVRLWPLREDEWSAFREDSKREYAADMVDNGGFTREAAERKAERDFATLLTDGLATEGHFIFAIEGSATGETVGRLWFARRMTDAGEVAFLFDIHLDEGARGKGLGRAAMLALEEEARRPGSRARFAQRLRWERGRARPVRLARLPRDGRLDGEGAQQRAVFAQLTSAVAASFRVGSVVLISVS